MGADTARAEDLYQVVVNQEGQYSIWADDREPPAGWRSVKRAMSRDGALAFIESEWTDMRPLSLRAKPDASR